MFVGCVIVSETKMGMIRQQNRKAYERRVSSTFVGFGFSMSEGKTKQCVRKMRWDFLGNEGQ